MIKAADTKSSTGKAKQQQPAGNSFFGKEEGNDAFFGESDKAKAPFFVQRKLTIGKPDDHYEKQADQVADKVVQRMSQPAATETKSAAPAPVSTVPSGHVPAAAAQPGALQMKEQEGKEEEISAEEKKVQRKPIFDSMGDPPDNIQKKESGAVPDSGAKDTANSGLEARLQKTKGAGTPLPSDTRTAMESSIGADFSNVRVHTGNEAAELSNDLQAQAFTHGNDIYFNDNKFDATSSTGRHLLAHELTHTVQQSAAVQKKADPALSDAIQRAPAAKPAAVPSAAPGEVVNISSGSFNPSANLAEAIKGAGRKGLDVNINAGKIAGAGVIKVREKEGVMESLKNAYLPLNMPMFSAANPMLAVRLANGEVSGFATIGQSNAAEAIPQWLRKNGKALGWLTGIDVENVLSKATNTFENGAFTFTLNGVKVKVGSFAEATMDLGFVNMKPSAHVTAELDIHGVAKGNLDITLVEDKMSGEGAFGVSFKGFSGEIAAKFQEGVLDVKGMVGYSGDRLSGSLMLVMTDKKTADNFAKTQLGGAPAEEAVPPADVPAAEGKGPRGIAGMGTLTFNMTEWFAGSVNVIVDGKGFVTVIGKIAPPKEIILFQQKDYNKELFKLEARAAYGLPVIGNVFVFANMALIALAKVGPAKIYNIEVAGTYSNDPDIAKNISLSGSLNMSAYAGLRLRAEGGAGIELAGHDLKVGVGINADAGVKGYVDARPTIGYRDPGEFFFKGHMEIAAQPFLGLSGDLFVELDSPWWSPLPDKKWTWPIGALEYPLPGEFGIGADMEYVLGSGKVPEVTFSEAKFDGAKFMTDLVDDHVPSKSGGGDKDKQGKFVDGGAAGATPPAGAAPPAAAPGKPAAGGKPGAGGPAGGAGKGKEKDKGKADPEAMKNFAAAMKKVKELEGHKPMTRAEITAAIEVIKKQHNTPGITFAPKGGDIWIVTGSMQGKPNKQSVKVKAIITPGDDKEQKGDDKEKAKKLDLAIQDLKNLDTTTAGDGKLTDKEAKNVAKKTQEKHNDVFKSIKVIDGGKKANWQYQYVQKVENPVNGSGHSDLPPRVEKLKDDTVTPEECQKLLDTATGIVGEAVMKLIYSTGEKKTPEVLRKLLQKILTLHAEDSIQGLRGGFRVEPVPQPNGVIWFWYVGFTLKNGDMVLGGQNIRPRITHPPRQNLAYVNDEKQLNLDFNIGPEVHAAGVEKVGTRMLDISRSIFRNKFTEIKAQWVANELEYKKNYYGGSDNLEGFIKVFKKTKSEKKAAESTWTGSRLVKRNYRFKEGSAHYEEGDQDHFDNLFGKDRNYVGEDRPKTSKKPKPPRDLIKVEVIFEPDPDKPAPK